MQPGWADMNSEDPNITPCGTPLSAPCGTAGVHGGSTRKTKENSSPAHVDLLFPLIYCHQIEGVYYSRVSSDEPWKSIGKVTSNRQNFDL